MNCALCNEELEKEIKEMTLAFANVDDVHQLCHIECIEEAGFK